MTTYDYYLKSETANISKIGKKLVNYRNSFFINLIRQFCKSENIHILEIGPGKGYFADVCKLNKLDYTAIEGNLLMNKSLKERGYKVYNMYVPPINLEKKFDVIFMNQVFEHMDNKNEALKLLESCKKQLNDGGILIISCPDIIFHKEDFYQDYTHGFPTTMIRVQNMLNDCGFKIVHSNYYTFLFEGYVFARIMTSITRLFYSIGMLHLIFGKKAYKAKISLLPSFVLVARA